MSEIQHRTTRSYANTQGTAYNLPHDEEERWRLTTQSNLFLRSSGNKVLHAPVQLTDEDRVLETATGTGIWLSDLAKETSSKPQFLGTDIQSYLFPEPSTLPPNMKFEVHSVLELPPDWTDQFTVAHQRLLIAGLRTHEWPRAIGELYRVIKPGGWVQLLELDTWTSGPALAKHLEMLHRLSDEKGFLWRDLTRQIPTFLERSGFVNLGQKSFVTPLGGWAGQDGVDGRENLLSICRGLKKPMLEGGGYGIVNTEGEYDELLEQMREEFDNTPGSQSRWVIFWAQKPVKPA